MRMQEIKSGPQVDSILKEIQEYFGMLPKLWTLYANNAALLEANWRKQKLVMGEGVLRAELQQAIAFSVSIANACPYCVDAHKAMLDSLGVNTSLIEKESYVEAGFTEKEKSLLEFANEANLNAYKLSDALYENLHTTGCTNAEILEALGIVELYTGYNIFLNTLNVPGGSL